MTEKITRAKSALAGKWVSFGKYAWVCGNWTVCAFVANGKEVFMLYNCDVTVGRYGTRKEAMLAAREKSAA